MKANDESAAVTQHGKDGVFDASDILNSTEVEGDVQEMSGYVQDNFDFLDQMDCSVLDHMDCSMPCQVWDLSVEMNQYNLISTVYILRKFSVCRIVKRL